MTPTTRFTIVSNYYSKINWLRRTPEKQSGESNSLFQTEICDFTMRGSIIMKTYFRIIFEIILIFCGR